MMRRTFTLIALVALQTVSATEVLHPLLPPKTWASTEGSVELDDDVYSADLTLSGEFAYPLLGGMASLYVDVSFRFLSYSYEYAIDGYIHNYCNLHVNGINETYIGAKYWFNGPGLNLGWRFPPGEGSQLNRFHRLNIEPFYTYRFSKNINLGTSIRYNKLYREKDFEPGDEIGFKFSLDWKFLWNEEENSGWIFDQVFLYQVRFQESENLHMAGTYRKMDDAYQGLKIRFDVSRVLGFVPIGVGFNYEFHQGTLFGFEVGHRIGIYAKYL